VSLHAVLRSLGYSTAEAPGEWRKHIVRRFRARTDVAFTGTASDVWEWLDETGQHAREVQP
jgi:hypothetical protein